MGTKWVWAEVIIGSLMFAAANILAILFHYDKFYTLLVIGITLAMKGAYRLANRKELLSLANFTEVYVVFAILGFVADYVFGIWITDLWYYPGYSLANYILLYLVGYPFGAFTLVYSFALMESLFVKKPKEKLIDYRHALAISRAIILIGVAGIFISLYSLRQYAGFWLYISTTVYGYGIVNYLSLRISKDDVMERLLVSFAKYAGLILFVSYVQALLQELPNVHGKEWIYQNMPLSSVTLFGIPLIVPLVGWIALLILPYSVFELVLKINSIRKGKSFFRDY